MAKITMTFEDVDGETVKTSVNFGPDDGCSRAMDTVMYILEYMETMGSITEKKFTPNEERQLNG